MSISNTRVRFLFENNILILELREGNGLNVRILRLQEESPTKRIFFAVGAAKRYYLANGPTYPSPSFGLHKYGNSKGPADSAPLNKSPSYPRSRLTGVYCT